MSSPVIPHPHLSEKTTRWNRLFYLTNIPNYNNPKKSLMTLFPYFQVESIKDFFY